MVDDSHFVYELGLLEPRTVLVAEDCDKDWISNGNQKQEADREDKVCLNCDVLEEYLPKIDQATNDRNEVCLIDELKWPIEAQSFHQIITCSLNSREIRCEPLSHVSESENDEISDLYEDQ